MVCCAITVSSILKPFLTFSVTFVGDVLKEICNLTPGPVSAQVTEKKFENGLKLVYQQRVGDEVSAISIFCKVGSVEKC